MGDNTILDKTDFYKKLDNLLASLNSGLKDEILLETKNKVKANLDSYDIIHKGQGSQVQGSPSQGSPGQVSLGQGPLELFYIANKGYIQNPSDKYNFFSKIKGGLFSEFKDILHEDGLIKGMKVGYESSRERLRKYYYLFHNVKSGDEPVTALQYACMWNRLDMVILILSYLVGCSKDYVAKYINYYASSPDISPNKIKGRAIDLIGTSHGMGGMSSLRQGASALTNLPKALLNPIGSAFNLVGKTGKAVSQVGQQTATAVGAITNPIEILLKEFGSKEKGIDDGSDLVTDIKALLDDKADTDPYYQLPYLPYKKVPTTTPPQPGDPTIVPPQKTSFLSGLFGHSTPAPTAAPPDTSVVTGAATGAATGVVTGAPTAAATGVVTGAPATEVNGVVTGAPAPTAAPVTGAPTAAATGVVTGVVTGAPVTGAPATEVNGVVTGAPVTGAPAPTAAPPDTTGGQKGGDYVYSPTLEKYLRTRKFRRGNKGKNVKRKTARRKTSRR